MASALEGIRLLDLSRLLPGAYCTMLLADLGAEVLKIEQPGPGDYMRQVPPMAHYESYYFLMVNRNKKSMTLNLKSKQGQEIFFRLARRYDVILEGFRPGIMDRLGIGYEAVRQVNPAIVYCSLSGFGQDGPYRNLVGHDLNYIGIGGLLALLAPREGPPPVPGVQIADLGGGWLAALGILAALVHRERTGQGQYVDAAMLDMVVSWLPLALGEYLATGKPPRPQGTTFGGGLACYNLYRTRDGRYLTLGAYESHFWANLCQALGREDLIERQFAPDQENIRRELQEIFLAKTRDEWLEFFRDRDVPCGPLNTLEETFSDPQVLHRGMLTKIDHPREGRIRQLGIPLKFSETPGQIKSPPPGLGQHTEGVLHDLGYDSKQITELRNNGVI